MGRSRESYQKKEVRNKKEKKRKEKEKKRLERKESGKRGSLEEMLAYVDENGHIIDTPPDPDQKSKVKAEDIEVSVPKNEDSEPDNPIHTGTITFFNHSKGFGFIRDTMTGQSIFVHVNNLLETVAEGDRVVFETEPGQKGPEAVRVKLEKEEKGPVEEEGK